MIKVERKNNQMMISVEGDVATLAGETEMLLRALRENMEEAIGKEATTEVLELAYERSKLSEEEAVNKATAHILKEALEALEALKHITRGDK
ncbi:hypothetical protein DXA59_00625 [Clostridium sp. OF03-18AA]|nr:hypothetical protein [Clostridium sp. OF03-18AA]RHP71519.1 hypothetical protein DXA59_00625 [Clostridium sp. OF03-18AA]